MHLDSPSLIERFLKGCLEGGAVVLIYATFAPFSRRGWRTLLIEWLDGFVDVAADVLLGVRLINDYLLPTVISCSNDWHWLTVN